MRLPRGRLMALVTDLLTELDLPRDAGVVLLGSHARGDAGPASDVDLCLFVPAGSPLPPRYRLVYRGGRLISLSAGTPAEKREELNRPERAIWAVPGLRQARVLRDPGGAVALLVEEARRFCWEPLRAAAGAYAAASLAGLAEEVHKVLGGLGRGDESALAYATLGLALGLTEAVAVGSGILIESENAYFRQVEEAVGLDAAWTRWHRAALGLGPEASLVSGRALAALGLYRETAGLLGTVLQPAHREVVDPVLHALGQVLDGWAGGGDRGRGGKR